MPNNWDKTDFNIEKNKIRICQSIKKVNCTRLIDSNLRQKSGNVWNVLATMPVTFYSKREGEMASVVRTNKLVSQICKRNKKVLIIKWLKSILLSIQLMQQRRINNTNEFYGLFLTTDDLFHFHIQFIPIFSSTVYASNSDFLPDF
jgi:hypothetical protein